MRCARIAWPRRSGPDSVCGQCSLKNAVGACGPIQRRALRDTPRRSALGPALLRAAASRRRVAGAGRAAATTHDDHSSTRSRSPSGMDYTIANEPPNAPLAARGPPRTRSCSRASTSIRRSLDSSTTTRRRRERGRRRGCIERRAARLARLRPRSIAGGGMTRRAVLEPCLNGEVGQVFVHGRVFCFRVVVLP